MCNGRWRWQQARCRHSPSPPADRGVTPEEGQTARQRHCLSLEGSGNTRQSSVLATQVAEAEGNGSVLASPCHPHGGGVIGREMAGLRRHGAEAGRGENGHTPSSSRTRPASGARLQPAPPTSVSYSAARDLSDRCDKSTHSSRHVTSAFAFASASFCALVTEYSWRKFFISGRATQSVAHSDTERCFRPTNGHFASAIPSNPSHLDRDPPPSPTQHRTPACPHSRPCTIQNGLAGAPSKSRFLEKSVSNLSNRDWTRIFFCARRASVRPLPRNQHDVSTTWAH